MADTELNLSPESVRSAAESSDDVVATALPIIQGLTQLHDSIAVIDHSGRIVWLSDSLASRCGGARALGGRDWLEALVEPVTRLDLTRRLHEFGGISNEPVMLRGSEGRRLPARVSAACIGKKSDCCSTVAIFRDEEASETQQTLEYVGAILDAAPEGVLVVDHSRFITYANPVLSRMTGYPVGVLVDKPLALLIRPGHDFERIAHALRSDVGPGSGDVEMKRRDGTLLRVNVSAKPFELPDGSSAGAVAYVRDVTEQRRTEEALAHKNAELEHYVHAVSHDLRSPLVAILGFARLLREDFAEEIGDKGQHFLHRIEEAGRTMEALVQDLLELARIEQMGISPDLVDPRPVLLQIQAEMKSRLDAAGVALVLPADPPVIRCDRTHLYRLFGNLLGNALQHMGDDMGDEAGATIRVSFEPHEHGTKLCVSDNGRGIDPDEHDRIFQIFQARGSSGGTGIGLAVVRKIAEAHGGQAWVESAPGAGARFYATLPV